MSGPAPTNHTDPWREARDWADLTHAAEAFFLGELEVFPGWGAPDLDEESDELVPTLVAAARAGWLTTASQPGRPFAPGHDGRPWGQRAFVCGFAPPTLADSLADALRSRGLWCFGGALPFAEPPVPAGLRDGVPYLFAGHDAAAEERELFSEDLSPEGARTLSQFPFLWAVDPVWGRRNALLGALEGPLGTIILPPNGPEARP